MEEKLSKFKNSSIKNKFIKNLILMLLISFVLTVIVLVGFVKSYFYQNHINNMENVINVKASYYQSTYAPYTSLIGNIYDDKDTWWREENYNVRLYDLTGQLLLDSSGSLIEDDKNQLEDVKKALEGVNTHSVYRDSQTKEHVVSVSVPLKTSNSIIVGVIRYTSSLKEVDRNIFKIGILFFLIGGIISGIAGFIGVYLAQKFVSPITSLTDTAIELTKGNYSVRSKKMYNDEIGTLSDTFNLMAGEIKKKEDLKNDFISSVSHELRTPLTAIKGWAITLKDPQTDKELLSTGLNIIEDECDRLKTMVEELLDFSRFVSNKVVLNIKKINLSSLIIYINNFLNERSIREGKNFEIVVNEEIDSFEGDENRIKQVLINLLDNAFKFTELNDSITLEIKQDNEWNYFIITDTGIGIPSHEITKVKEKFFKGKHSRSQNGIGLSICDEIAKLHGGSLEIHSRYGEGTSIILQIPRRIIRNEEVI